MDFKDKAAVVKAALGAMKGSATEPDDGLEIMLLASAYAATHMGLSRDEFMRRCEDSLKGMLSLPEGWLDQSADELCPIPDQIQVTVVPLGNIVPIGGGRLREHIKRLMARGGEPCDCEVCREARDKGLVRSPEVGEA